MIGMVGKESVMLTITPSVASANQLYLADEMRSFDQDTPLHVDIEDGNLVSNITFGMRTVMSLAESFPNPLDYHILATRPSDYYKDISKTNTRYVIVPFEALKEPMCDLDMIRDLGMKPALSFEMHTPISVLEAFADEVECVLLSTYGSSSGGLNGLGFRRNSLERIRRAREMMHPGTTIIVDGGIGLNELRLSYEAGADTAVLGRLLFPEEVSQQSGRKRVLLPSDRSVTPAERMKRILDQYNGVKA